LLSALLYFFLIILVSRWLGPSERGVCGLFLLIIAIIAGISDIAGGAATAFLLKNHEPWQLQKWQMIWSIVPSLIVPFIFFLFSAISLTELILLAIAGWLNSSWNMQQQLLLGMHFFIRFNVMNFIAPALSLFLFFGLWQLNMRNHIAYLLALGLAWLFVFAVSMPFLIKKMNTREKSTNTKSIGTAFKGGLLNQFSHLVSLLNGRMVFFILPATMLGIWSNTLTIAEALFMIPGSIGQVMYSLVASKKGDETDEKQFKIGWWANLILSGLALLTIFLIPDTFWKMLFGKDFSGLKNVLNTLLPGIGLYSIYLITSYRQSASGYFLKNLISVSIGLIINALVTFFYIFSGNYTLFSGIIALSAGWIATAISSLFMLGSSFPIALNAVFNIEALTLKARKIMQKKRAGE
jgi:O-antigen/teichoic acid export membrane protein